MGDVINLRRARKTKARADKAVVAAAHRLQFGRTKSQRIKDAQDDARLARVIDGAFLKGEDKPE